VVDESSSLTAGGLPMILKYHLYWSGEKGEALFKKQGNDNRMVVLAFRPQLTVLGLL